MKDKIHKGEISDQHYQVRKYEDELEAMKEITQNLEKDLDRLQIEKNDMSKKLVDWKNGLLLSSMVSDIHTCLGMCERKIEKEDN